MLDVNRSRQSGGGLQRNRGGCVGGCGADGGQTDSVLAACGCTKHRSVGHMAMVYNIYRVYQENVCIQNRKIEKDDPIMHDALHNFAECGVHAMSS